MTRNERAAALAAEAEGAAWRKCRDHSPKCAACEYGATRVACPKADRLYVAWMTAKRLRVSLDERAKER